MSQAAHRRLRTQAPPEDQDNLQVGSSEIRPVRKSSRNSERKSGSSELIGARKKPRQFVKRVSLLVWTGLAIVLVFQNHFFSYFFRCVNYIPRDAILVCLGILSMILGFGGFYLPYVRRQRHDIDVSHPQLIYIASALIMSVIVLQQNSQNRLFVGYWSIYGKWTIAMIPLLCLGYMMSMHFLPNGLIGGICFVLANVGIVALQCHFDTSQGCPNQN